MGYVIVMIPLNLIESIKSYLAENSGTVYGSPEKKMHNAGPEMGGPGAAQGMGG